jgi:ankyrin repeat protein
MFCFRFVLYLLVFIVVASARAGSFDDFFRAVKSDDAAVVGQLLQRGFDPNAHDESGQSALTLAANEGAMRVVETLLQHPQIDVNAPNHAGETALMLAALRGRMNVVQRLLAHGATIEQTGWGPLHYAATGPDPQIVRLLIDKGAKIDARSPNGTTPLMMAARYGSEQSVTLLLSSHADLNVRNERGMTAADFARAASRDALAKRLESRSP